MNNEVLERLLIDRAAGELPPDVEELLEAHLEQDPMARNEAAEIGETLRLALAGQPASEVLLPFAVAAAMGLVMFALGALLFQRRLA